MRIILFLIGLALSVDGLYCGWTGSMGLGEAMIVGAGVIFIVWSSFYEAFREKGFLRFLKGVFSIAMLILVVYSCAICLIGRMDNDTGREDYAIVLGAGLQDNEPSAVLQSRLDKTLEYLDQNTSATVIVSGGRGEDELGTEAQAMANYLISNGIGDGKILLEENASSTYENFYYSKDAVSDGNSVFITSDYHVLRSAFMARLNGIDAAHIGASTPLPQIPVCCARELAAQIASVRYYLPF